MTNPLHSLKYVALAAAIGGAASYFLLTGNDASIQSEKAGTSWVAAAFPTAQASFAAHHESRS